MWYVFAIAGVLDYALIQKYHFQFNLWSVDMCVIGLIFFTDEILFILHYSNELSFSFYLHLNFQLHQYQSPISCLKIHLKQFFFNLESTSIINTCFIFNRFIAREGDPIFSVILMHCKITVDQFSTKHRNRLWGKMQIQSQ